MNYKSKSLEERFWEKVDKTADCWVWTASCASGYGRICRGGHSGPQVQSHRLSWEIHNGPIPEGLQVLHHCDNKKCVRPDHLFLGSQLDNMRDMIFKGRHCHGEARSKLVRGEQSGNAKLTERQVQDMKSYLSQGVLPYILAKYFQVNWRTISAIKCDKSWRHVEGLAAETA